MKLMQISVFCYLHRLVIFIKEPLSVGLGVAGDGQEKLKQREIRMAILHLTKKRRKEY
jgi:hypothetical protein